MRYMYVLCGNMMNDPQHCCLYLPLCYLDAKHTKYTSEVPRLKTTLHNYCALILCTLDHFSTSCKRSHLRMALKIEYN